MKDKYEAIKEIIALSREDLDDLPNRAEKELSANEVELASLRDALTVETEEGARYRQENSKHRAKLAAADKLKKALREVMSWVKNWDVDFMDDDAWDKTQTRVDKALAEYRKAGK